MNTDDHDASCLSQFDPPYSFLRSVFPMTSIQREEASEFSRLREQSRYVEQTGQGSRNGIILWNSSEFDSSVLERNAAKVQRILVNDPQVASDLVRKLVGDLRAASVSYTSVRVPADYKLVHTLEDEGFRIVDGVIYLFVDLRAHEGNHSLAVYVRPFVETDTEALLAISESAFVYGRFYHDPVITQEQANRVYRTWVKNSLNGTAADTVLVAEYEGVPAAFVTLKKHASAHISVGSVELLAVSAAARGKGLGSALLAAAAAYFRKQECSAMIVDTQIHNQPALGLYTKFGFKFGKTYITLRLHL